MSSSELSDVQADLATDEELEQLAQQDDNFYEDEDSEENEVEDDEEEQPVTASARQGRVTIKYMPTRERRRVVNDDEDDFVKTSSLTERQRAKLVESNSQTPEPFMELSEGSKRRVLTEEESQLRKQENARKRKNHNERKLEEEKQDTLNKLLKKRAGKVGTTEGDQEEPSARAGDKPRRPMLEHPALFTWKSTASETVLRVPF